MPDFRKPYSLTDDPSFAHGMNSIAKLFAPPGAHEALYGAQTQKLKAEEQRLSEGLSTIAQLYGPEAAAFVKAGVTDPMKQSVLGSMFTQYKANPALKPSDLDTPSYIIHGNANNTFQGVGTNNEAAAARNAADNARAIEERRMMETGLNGRNAADNVRAKEVASMNNAESRWQFERAPQKVGTGEQLIMSPEAAAAMGQPQIVNGPKKAPTAAEVGNYRTATGEMGMFRVGADGLPVDAMTGKPLPAGSTELKQQSTGTPDQFSKQPEWQAKGALAAKELAAPIERLAAAIDAGKLPVGVKDMLLNSLTSPTTAPMTVPLMDPDAQQAFNDLRSATQTYLFLKSGANVPETEVNRELLNTLPVPGEDPRVTEVKKQTLKNRLQFIKEFGGAQPAAPGAAPLDQQLRGEKGAPSPASQAPKPPAIGEVKGGYRFKGGNPADPASWEAVQ